MPDYDRAREAARLYYEEEMTFQQVGDILGVTRERVRQLVNLVDRPGSGRRASPGVARRKREREAARDCQRRDNRDEIAARYRQGQTSRAIAADLGMRPEDVARVVREALTAAELSLARGKMLRGPIKKPDEELLADLRRAVSELPGLTAFEFSAWARLNDARSHQTYLHRFGSWNEALLAAGATPQRESGRHYRPDRVTEERCLAAVISVAKGLGRLPSAGEYADAALGNPLLPSGTTVRHRLGGGYWSRVLAAAEKGRKAA